MSDRSVIFSQLPVPLIKVWDHQVKYPLGAEVSVSKGLVENLQQALEGRFDSSFYNMTTQSSPPKALEL